MTPKEEELLDGGDGSPSFSAISSTNSTITSSVTSSSTTLSTLNVAHSSSPHDHLTSGERELDNSDVVTRENVLGGPSAVENDAIVDVVKGGGTKLVSLSPSKSEKSSNSDNDTSELPSQRSVDSIGSSFECNQPKKGSVASPSTSYAERMKIPSQTSIESMGTSLDCSHLKNAISPLAALPAERQEMPEPPCAAAAAKCTLNLQRVCKSDSDLADAERASVSDFEDDAFLLPEASSVFCTCASGHPFVVDPRALAESAAPFHVDTLGTATTTTMSSCGSILSEKERCSNDVEASGSSYVLEPNLHLPNERCSKSRHQDETEKSFSCSNYVYDQDEDFFHNEFIQDSYPILSPQQIPYQVWELQSILLKDDLDFKNIS